MPPVLHTYGSRKKTRIPKYILKDIENNGDVFNVLGIDHIKDKRSRVSKASNKKRTEKENRIVPRTAIDDDSDSLFDRLFQGTVVDTQPVRTHKYSLNSTSSPESANDSNPPLLWMRPQHAGRSSKKGLRNMMSGRGKRANFSPVSLISNVAQVKVTERLSGNRQRVGKKTRIIKNTCKAGSLKNILSPDTSKHFASTSTPNAAVKVKMPLKLSPIVSKIDEIQQLLTKQNLIDEEHSDDLPCDKGAVIGALVASLSLKMGNSKKTCFDDDIQPTAFTCFEHNQTVCGGMEDNFITKNVCLPLSVKTDNFLDKNEESDNQSVCLCCYQEIGASSRRSSTYIDVESVSSTPKKFDKETYDNNDCSRHLKMTFNNAIVKEHDRGAHQSGCFQSKCSSPQAYSQTDDNALAASLELSFGENSDDEICELIRRKDVSIVIHSPSIHLNSESISFNNSICDLHKSSANTCAHHSRHVDVPFLSMEKCNVVLRGSNSPILSYFGVSSPKLKMTKDELGTAPSPSVHLNSDSDPSYGAVCDSRGSTRVKAHSRKDKDTILKSLECKVILRRCDSPSARDLESKECKVILRRCDSPSARDLESKECKVILRRCDSLSARNCDAGWVYPNELQETACSVWDLSVHESDAVNTTQYMKKSLREGISLLTTTRRSVHQDAVMLKPGKKWRRSLSILHRHQACDMFDENINKTARKTSITNYSTDIRLGNSSTRRTDSLKPVEETSHDIEIFSQANLNRNGDLLNESPVLECMASPIFLKTAEHCGSVSWCARNVVLTQCGQSEPRPFSYYYPPSMKGCCKKIGEGVYGEVFTHSGSHDRKPAVIKIIPIEGEMEVNGEPQKKFSEIISEIFIARHLSSLRDNALNSTETFNEVQAVHCVQGSYPDWLIDLWMQYDCERGSENDSPALFSADQLFIALELGHGGKDLESFIFSSAEQGLAAFKQIAVAMAVGERALNFEHRDLHWGNVLLASTAEDEVTFVLDGSEVKVATKGVKVSIIDFTLSRISDPVTDEPIFYDLSQDETLFTAQGDYQFDVYRLMKQFCRNDWSSFEPRTNIAWLHYLLDKLCTMARYRSRNSRAHKASLSILVEMKAKVLSFSDAAAFYMSAFV